MHCLDLLIITEKSYIPFHLAKLLCTTRDTLLVVSTVFTILSGQGEALNIDPASFYVHLYNNLFSINAVR